LRFDCIHCRKATTKPQSVKGAFLRMLTKQREQLVAKVRELQEKNMELQKVATNYYLYTAEGERLFCERHNCRIYPDNRGIYWHFKVADYPAYILPTEISRAYLSHEISIRDVYVHWHKNDR